MTFRNDLNPTNPYRVRVFARPTSFDANYWFVLSGALFCFANDPAKISYRPGVGRRIRFADRGGCFVNNLYDKFLGGIFFTRCLRVDRRARYGVVSEGGDDCL